jgi:hypothetical protein
MIPPLYPSQPSPDRLRSFGNYWARLFRLAENAPDKFFAAKVKLAFVKRQAWYHRTTRA